MLGTVGGVRVFALAIVLPGWLGWLVVEISDLEMDAEIGKLTLSGQRSGCYSLSLSCMMPGTSCAL